MAKRKQGRCYVYVVKDGVTPVYVGKGTGRRAQASAKKHGGVACILERDLSDCEAFRRERHWISKLMPVNNISPGGNGGRTKPKRKPRRSRVEMEIERLGSQKYCARYLLERLSEANCEQWGVSKVDLFRLREVAYG